MNSENTKIVTFPYTKYLSILYEGQRDDLIEIKMKDELFIPYKSKPEFLKEKMEDIKKTHKLFQDLLHCKAMEDYSGPVIFEGPAAADFATGFSDFT